MAGELGDATNLSLGQLAPDDQRVLIALHRLGGHASARQLADALLLGEDEVRWTLLALPDGWVDIQTDARTNGVSASMPLSAAQALRTYLSQRRRRHP